MENVKNRDSVLINTDFFYKNKRYNIQLQPKKKRDKLWESLSANTLFRILYF